MKINGYNNTLEEISLNAEDIENQIYKYKLDFPDDRRNDVEYEIFFPVFVYPFYNHVVREQSIPSQELFWKLYIEKNRDYLKNLNLSYGQKKAFKARIYRAYPSLVRDLHFGKILSRHKDFDDVFYNTHIDVDCGIDLILIKNGIKLGLILFTNTKNSLKARIRKRLKAKKVNIKTIELPIDFKESLKCGQFFLYSHREIKVVKDQALNALDIPRSITGLEIPWIQLPFKTSEQLCINFESS